MDFWDANFLKILGFWLVFNASKKVPGYFAIATEWETERDRERDRERVLYDYKLFLTRYVGLKVKKKCEIFAIFVFLPFFVPLERKQ